MNWEKVRNFWIEEADEALKVAEHLFDKQDFSYSLFFGHLAVEKLLKAIYVTRKKEQSPYLHNLDRLAEMSDIQFTEEQKERLVRITRFNLEARYPDEKRTFRKRCTEDFTRKELAVIEEVCKWLKSMLPH